MEAQEIEMAAGAAPAAATSTGSHRQDLIREALQDCLGQLCGGDVPQEATNQGSGAPPKMFIDQWRSLLESSCREGIQATARGGQPQNLEATRGKPWDFEVRCITSLFHRLCRSHDQQKKKHSNKKKRKKKQMISTEKEDDKQDQHSALAIKGVNDKNDSRTTVTSKRPSLLLTSDLGVQRTVQSASDWSQYMLPLLDDRLPRGWDCRVHPPSGFLLLVSPERALALREADRRPCPSCTEWPKGGEKGLWWHQQQQHGVHHASATACAAQTRVVQALILYQEPATLSELLASLGTEKTICNSNRLQNDTEHSSTSDKDKAFQYAADGNLQALRQAISEKHVDPTNDMDNRGASVLLWAAGGGHVETVRYLVEDCHCDPATKQKQHKRGFAGRTALHWACRKGHLKVVQYLLDPSTAGGGPKLLWDRTADGTNCIGWAAWQGQLNIMKWIYNTYRHQNYPEAVSSGEQNVVEDCFLTVNKFGCNALLWAAQGAADAETMDWLVQVAKVPLTHTNSNGHGILHKAGQRNRPEIASWLQSILRELLATDSGDEIHAFPISDNPITTMAEKIIPLIGPDEEGCTSSDLAGIEGHVELAVQMWDMEEAIFLAILARTRAWPLSWIENSIALSDSWGPGCGVARFRKLFEEQMPRKRDCLGQQHPIKPAKVAAL